MKKVCWIDLTHRCNLRCSWCYMKQVGYANEDIDIFLLYKLVDFCEDAKVDKIVFVGGEPTLYPELIKVLTYCKNKNLKTEITTNGIKLSDIEYLNSLFEAGLTSIMISIKGYDSKDYMNTTGVDAYQEVLNAIDNINKFNIKVGISFVLTQDFIKGLKSVLNDIYRKDISVIVFSCVKEEKKESDNSACGLIKTFYDDFNDISECLNNKRWCIELCSPIYSEDKKYQQFLRNHTHHSCELDYKNGIYVCKKYDKNRLVFNIRGELLSCNTKPFDIIGKYGENFISYSDYIEYIDTR